MGVAFYLYMYTLSSSGDPASTLTHTITNPTRTPRRAPTLTPSLRTYYGPPCVCGESLLDSFFRGHGSETQTPQPFDLIQRVLHVPLLR